ncbi:Triacylglycerol lipase 2 [Linum perenne]
MAKALTFIIWALLCKFTVSSGRSFLSSINQTTTTALQPSLSDGICELMITSQGYTCEEHTDGMTWLLLPPRQSLAFVLADHGYDVWIANSRGTKYSRGHTSLSTDEKGYWDWSWDELVNYDLPATVDYVHNQTGQNMHYIGHSQGTLTALAAFSKGQLMNRLRSATLLCPVAYLGQMSSFLAKIGADIFLGEDLYNFHLKEFDPKGLDAANLLHNICEVPGVDCGDLMTAITVVRRGSLAMFDYDNEDDNMSHYGEPSPPDYNITNIPKDFPLFFSYGGTDSLADKGDVRMMLNMLSRSDEDSSDAKFMTQFVNNYAHADYVMSESAKEEVYDLVLTFIKLH